MFDPLSHPAREAINVRRFRSKSLVKLDLKFNRSPINVNDQSAVPTHQKGKQTMDSKITVGQFSFGTEGNNQRYLSMHHLQTERKKERKAENQLKIIQLEVEDEIDGQTNGRQREWNSKMNKKKLDRALNTSGSLDLCDSSIRSQSIRNTQALKEMSSSRLHECNQHSQQKGFLLKDHRIYDSDEFHNQYSKFAAQKQYHHRPADQMIGAVQNHHIGQYHYQEQQEAAA